MQLSKASITAILTDVASQEDGFNEMLQITFEAMIKSERQEHLLERNMDKMTTLARSSQSTTP